MTTINLLPWREEVRQLRNLKFYVLSGAAAFVSLLILIGTQLFITHRIQVERNNIEFLRSEQRGIEDKVKEIQGLQRDKGVLLERMNVIQSLETDRLIVPKFLDALPKSIPEGVFLKGLARRNEVVTIQGNAQTNANISAFMKNLEDIALNTKLFRDIKLTEVKTDASGTSLDFTIELSLGTSG